MIKINIKSLNAEWERGDISIYIHAGHLGM